MSYLNSELILTNDIYEKKLPITPIIDKTLSLSQTEPNQLYVKAFIS